MPELIDRSTALEKMCGNCKSGYGGHCPNPFGMCNEYESILQVPAIEAEPVRHGRWIECDYKHIEHGMIETEPKAGLCCSECRIGFKKNRMTYKAFCPACGARMDGGTDNA